MQCDFEAQLTEIVAARRFAEGVLGSVHPRLDEALVVVSELASNAIRHAGTGFRLSVDEDQRRVRIAVTDHGPGWPQAVGLDLTRPGGMGLRLVDALTDRWGTSAQDDGKTVWAELDEPG